jgi:hypothetical protein
MELWEIALIVSMAILLLTFLLVILRLYNRISPLLDSFTNDSGSFQMPDISIKKALGWFIYKAAEAVNFEKLLGGFYGGKK